MTVEPTNSANTLAAQAGNTSTTNGREFTWYISKINFNWDSNELTFLCGRIAEVIVIPLAFIVDLFRGVAYVVSTSFLSLRNNHTVCSASSTPPADKPEDSAEPSATFKDDLAVPAAASTSFRSKISSRLWSTVGVVGMIATAVLASRFLSSSGAPAPSQPIAPSMFEHVHGCSINANELKSTTTMLPVVLMTTKIPLPASAVIDNSSNWLSSFF